MKKAISLIVLISVVLSVLTACSFGKGQTQQTTAADGETTIVQKPSVSSVAEKKITLGYYANKSLDPYKTKSQTNADIMSLVYDSLFKVSSSFDAVPEIAEKYERAEKAVIVTLKEGITFSNSSPLTVNDIVYSYKKAKKSPIYKKRLSDVSSVTVGDNQIVFNLKKENIYIVNCLDFPIVSSDSDGKTLEAGSGRYVLKGKKNSYYLERNPNYSLGEQLESEKLYLNDISENDNKHYLLQVGELSFVFDDRSRPSSGEKVNANTAEISLTNLIYLAFNKDSEALNGGKNIRNAISLLIDKDTVCSSSYGSEAVPCQTPFNSNWSEVKLFAEQSTSGDLAAAQDLLEKDGYTYAYSNNKFISKNFEFLSLNFIYPSGDSRKESAAKQIVKQLNRAGIEVKAEKLSFDEYKSRLSQGEYDIYLGETKLTKDMNLGEFFSENGSVNYGIDTKSTAADAYYDFAGGKIDVTTFVAVFNQYTPFVPLFYRNGCVLYSREIRYDGVVSEGDIFANVYSWSV